MEKASDRGLDVPARAIEPVTSVTLFYNGACPECLRTRDRLAREFERRGIPFTALEATQSIPNREHLIRSAGQIGTPVVLVNKRAVIGIDRARLAYLLGFDVGFDHSSHW